MHILILLLGWIWVRQVQYSARSDIVQDFVSPARQYRPKFRYWLPDASVSSHQVIKDIYEISKVGAGGLEFLAYYNYGQYIRADIVDRILPGNWSKDGFGSEPFINLLNSGLRAAVDEGLMFDIPLGGSQGQGVPAEYQSSGLLKELIRGSTQVEAGTTYRGLLPSPETTTDGYNSYTRNFAPTWGAPNFKFKAAVAAELTGQMQKSGDGNFQKTLRADSLIELTSLVTANGTIEWTAPNKSSNGESWILFGFYERFTDMRNVLVPEGVTTWADNGSWVVDHFSATGAKKITDFFDTKIFNRYGMSNVLPMANGLTWEDSMEFPSILYWTPGLLPTFKRSRKYDLVPYLPIIHCGETSWTAPYNVTYVLDSSSARTTEMVLDDFHEVLNEGYYDYLDHLETWSNKYELRHSCQPAYNLPLDMAASVPHVAVPELESLAFGNSIFNYKQFTGAAHITGRNIISTEVGAVNEGTYELSVPRLKALFQGFFAAGVNMMMIHGFPYGGEYYDATWPGFTTFHYQYTDMYGPRQPQWRHFNDTILYTARNQLILQTGVPKLDLVFLYHSERWSGYDLPDAAEYTKTGFSYEFIDPNNLASPNVLARNQLLMPDGPGYKALVIYNQSQITVSASEKLLDLAKEGLPIFIVGQVPIQAVGSIGSSTVKANMHNLISGIFENVHLFDSINFSPSTLIRLGLQPRVMLSSPTNTSESLYTFWRSDEEKKTEFVYIVNQGPDNGPYSTFTFSFENLANSTPYTMDAWTGHQNPLVMYNVTSDGRLTITMRLKSQVSVIIGFRQGRDRGQTVISVSPNVKNVIREASGRLMALVNNDQKARITIAGRQTKYLPSGQIPAAMNLTEWELVIESYEPVEEPKNGSTVTASKIRNIDVGYLQGLRPWTNIPGLQNVSGVGRYRTEFNWPSHPEETAVLVSFGEVLNTLRAWVNNKLVPPVDIADAYADITDFIQPGRNSLVIEVSSTLFNAVKARREGIRCLGESPKDVPAFNSDWRPFGLLGPVTLEPLRKVPVS